MRVVQMVGQSVGGVIELLVSELAVPGLDSGSVGTESGLLLEHAVERAADDLGLVDGVERNDVL